ncbi:uncharacterized protein LOC115628722 [Scaptodrosophila lebanonensis]|uniref:Uncharacterized protein LOC115628722 n=1 Tax=Drosophila lebanonensis TaxID=7225 RepID=A0A6J2TZZ4_DROLE|nr:uncharacterized protein LOC115628722 [Scaptodrosophila lebanonensis]
MHTIEVPALNGLGQPISDIPAGPASYQPQVIFAPNQTAPSQARIGSLVADLTARGQFFYGIEITARTAGKPTHLDFNDFLPVLPTFVSLVWLGWEYWKVHPIEHVNTLTLAKHLEPHIPVMPHLSAYRLSEKRLDAFLAMNLSNMLAVRGDKVYADQIYTYSQQLVKRARRARGDTLSIGVGGYPEGYTNEPTHTHYAAQSIEHLREKVESGADFIITQFCYRPEMIVQFVRDCRAANITVPIMMGVAVPDSYRSYGTLEKITGVRLPLELRAQVEQLKETPAAVSKFFEDLALQIIQHVLNANVGVYGVQFFTMSRFKPVLAVLQQLRELGILQVPPASPETTNLI